MYEEFVYKREEDMDGISPWYWIKDETGAWTGPGHDWITSHKEKYLQYLKDTKVVVCAGGNQGMYPRVFSDHFQFVYTFEPDPLNFYVLSLNCQKDNIIKIQAALGEKPDSVAIRRANMENTGMHKIDGEGVIPQLTLDSFKFPQIDLLQLDVEGYEENIIRGGMEHIERFKPVIACENGNDTILNLLKPLGYHKADQSVADHIYVAS